MKLKNVFKFLLLVALALTTFGCGYTFQNSGSVLPPDIKKVYIPTVENKTSENRFTNLVTESLRERFERFGVVSVVETSSEADATLNVEIRSVNRQARSVTTGTDTVLQYDTSAVLWGEMRRNNGSVIWRNPTIRVTRAYGTTTNTVVTSSADFAFSGADAGSLSSLTDAELNRGQEQEALVSLAEEAARSIYDDSVAPDF
jgi:outer membrane lipopolysaccharide assembly protein LptE/RlpB